MDNLQKFKIINSGGCLPAETKPKKGGLYSLTYRGQIIVKSALNKLKL